jgi:hypothetical protein
MHEDVAHVQHLFTQWFDKQRGTFRIQIKKQAEPAFYNINNK